MSPIRGEVYWRTASPEDCNPTPSNSSFSRDGHCERYILHVYFKEMTEFAQMASTPQTAALEKWFRSNSGYLCEELQILHDEISGFHFRATKPIEPGSTIASAPHSIALSYLNALVDDSFPVFREQRHQFKVEAIGFFYLMAQYINREKSFWKPYLDTLPGPQDYFSQPMLFEAPEDVAWLEGTDVWHTINARKEVYKRYYEDGVVALERAGLDMQRYTWHLFKWSATIFASRSFTSLSLLSTGSKYRTAFKSGPEGRRQAVLLDMSGTPAEDLDFPVLFPGLDAANHSHEARVDWTFNPGQFRIHTNDGIQAGDEFFNNYGPKGNGELLIGYGFCLPNNPYDTVALTPKAPDFGLQKELKNVQPGYFNDNGEWSYEKATFRLGIPSLHLSDAREIFYVLPEPLLELLFYILRRERGLNFSFISQPMEYLSSRNGPGSRYLPQIARMIVQFLSQKLKNLQSVKLPRLPQNKKQTQASIYRQGQVEILQSITTALRKYTRSLIWTPSVGAAQLPTDPSLARLEDLIQVLILNGLLDASFLEGIKASANTKNLEQLRLAGWEEDVWVLLLNYLVLGPERDETWLRGMLPEYIDIKQPEASILGTDEMAQADSLLEIISAAASACPGSRWEDERWTPGFIVGIGGRMLQHESFTVMCPNDEGGEEARLCLYLHCAA